MTQEEDLKICKRCTYDSAVPGIMFDAEGICNYCRTADIIRTGHFKGESEKNNKKFAAMIEKVRREGRSKKFDCLVPLSGGVDSSYVLYKVKQYGLRPMAYTIDNGWSSDAARREMDRITRALGVPLKKITFDHEGLRELYVAALRASVPEICLPCQVATYSAMYKVSREEGIKYVFFGLSPLTEGIAPLEWGYIEGAYLRDIARKFAGRAGQKVIKDLNRLDLGFFLRNFFTGRTKIIQLPLYEEWDEEAIKTTLQKEFGWIGGEKHFDCQYNKFREDLIFKKFGFHANNIRYAALVRSGRISRPSAMKALGEGKPDTSKCSYKDILDRLGISEEEFERITRAGRKTFRDYRTHYSFIRKLKWIIWIGARLRVFPETTYAKFFR